MKKLMFGLAVLTLASCVHFNEPKVTETNEIAPVDTFELRVSLYPWIPDEEAFVTWVELRFKKEHPDINLIVRPMSKARKDKIDLAYDIEHTIEALNFENHEDRQHLVEIDTLILGKLVDQKVIQPFSLPRGDYFDFAEQAVTYDGDVYGVPHWTCGYFIMTTHQEVASASNAVELRDQLSALNTPYPDLGGYVADSWSDIVLYLDAALDTDPTANAADFADDMNIDPSVEPYLRAFGDACTNSKDAFCDVWGEMAGEFARDRLDALLGYSEQLNAVLETNPAYNLDAVYIEPAPMGGGKSTFLFTDAMVLSNECKTDRCKDAARRFVEFYVSDLTMAASMMGSGSVDGHPRYLLSATKGSFEQSAVASDPIYQQLRPLMDNALAYPNHGVPEARKSGVLKPLVRDLMHTPR